MHEKERYCQDTKTSAFVAHGVQYFQYFSALLQEMTIEIDEDFLFAALEFSRFKLIGQEEPEA